jgi:sulfofructose kinase
VNHAQTKPSTSWPLVDVVGVGLNATDTVIQLPHFPAFNSKVEFISATLLQGGQVASAMVACQRWGLHTRYIGKVGDDPAGELQAAAFVKEGVEAHLTIAPSATSQTSFILVDRTTGERTVLWNRDDRVALQPDDLKREMIVAARALLVDGHDTAAAACAARWAREAGIPVTGDFDNLYSGVEVLLEDTDFVISSREFPTRITGEQDLLKSLPAIQRRFNNRMVGATLGTDGVLVWDGNEFHYCSAFRVAAVDTTGAGDVFHAAFVYGLLAGWPIEEQLRFSCAAAGLNCKAIGARGGIASLAEIRTQMREGATYRDAYPARRFTA